MKPVALLAVVPAAIILIFAAFALSPTPLV